MRLAAAAVAAVALAITVTACGAAAPKPGPTLDAFVSAWSKGDWSAARAQLADPPADFTSINRNLFTALGVSSATITSGPVTTARSGRTASAPVTERYQLPDAGAWSVSSTVHLVKRKAGWRIRWAPSTITPKLGSGESIAVNTQWPARAPILGLGGAKLTTTGTQVIVGVEGERIKSYADVRADLLAAGATSAEVTPALAAAKAHPTYFEQVFTVSQARFNTLKNQPGGDNVYNVPGTTFHQSDQVTAITTNLAEHIVGTVGPITAAQLKQLGAPYTSSSVVGQSGLESQYEKQLAGTPTTTVDVEDSGGNPITRLATFPGKPGTAVQTSIDPSVQRAAEAALDTLPGKQVSMVAIKASTGQVLAAVSDPPTIYNTAFTGEYPPGSSFKILTSSMVFRKGLTPDSPASCPPTVNVDGETFHNAEGDQPVSNITEAFTESCNTAFIGLATQNLSPSDYTSIASLYDLRGSARLGLPAFMDLIPRPKSQTELAADAIGQGSVLFSALGMATVAADVDTGTVRLPRLVTGAPDDSAPTHKLPANILADLKPMMSDVVNAPLGTANGFGLPAGTYAKTGTAEYGKGPEADLKIDGWLVGYNGNIAFAIVVHDTGGPDGGPINGPVIAKFLDAIGD